MSTTAKAGGRRRSEDKPVLHGRRGLDLETAGLHGAGEPREEGAVVVDDEERVVLGHGPGLLSFHDRASYTLEPSPKVPVRKDKFYVES